MKSGILTEVRITSDPRANALIVSAPAAFGRKHVAPHAPAFLAGEGHLERVLQELEDIAADRVADDEADEEGQHRVDQPLPQLDQMRHQRHLVVVGRVVLGR